VAAEVIADHVEALRVRGYSKAAQDHARRVLPRLVSHLREEGIADARQASEEQLVRFAGTLRHLAPGSCMAYLGAVKRFYGFLEQELLMNPASELPLPRVTTLPRRVPTPADVVRLVEAPSDTPLGRRDRAILELLYGTGIRRGECLRLDVADVALSVLVVRDGKGRRDRRVPLLGRAASALRVYLDARRELASGPEESLFLTRDGHRLSKSALDLIVRRHARAAGVTASPHALRHACATHLLRGGADVRHVQELLGHASLQTTARYTRVDVEDLREVVSRCHPRARTRGRRSVE
jgi:site-specific recombinase XerD